MKASDENCDKHNLEGDEMGRAKMRTCVQISESDIANGYSHVIRTCGRIRYTYFSWFGLQSFSSNRARRRRRHRRKIVRTIDFRFTFVVRLDRGNYDFGRFFLRTSCCRRSRSWNVCRPDRIGRRLISFEPLKIVLVDPQIGNARPVDQFGFIEPDLHFPFGALRSIAGVHYVTVDQKRKAVIK